MKPAQIKTLRAELGLNVRDFGRLVGVEGSQVSRWETNQRSPTRFQYELLGRLRRASFNEDVGPKIKPLLLERGVMTTLLVVLAAAQR